MFYVGRSLGPPHREHGEEPGYEARVNSKNIQWQIQVICNGHMSLLQTLLVETSTF